ncbi:MAG: chemotaxis protein CheW [Thermodesulfovibrio sp.]|nr:chemotaxis protein CheW [Thermodesulfovibrio sp.]MDW7971985.1 chemotaxis protein CheW [Thermodesulfovibrio sp.]
MEGGTELNNTKTITALTFTLNEEIFALDIKSVKEVLDYTKITKIPQTPDYMLGVINLRGNVAPVVDLKMKFNMPKSEITVNTCIIIVEVEIEGKNQIVGILADSVKEVFEFDLKNIEEAPKIGLNIDIDFILGIAKRDEEFVIILDINKIFSEKEKEQIIGTETETPIESISKDINLELGE